jgi:hypothetical protein
VGEETENEPHTDTEIYLLTSGFSPTAARAFKHLPLAAVQADYTKRTQEGAGIGAIVAAWRVTPPAAQPPARRVTDMPILTARINGTVRKEWLERFRSTAPQEQWRVLEAFREAYPEGGTS